MNYKFLKIISVVIVFSLLFIFSGFSNSVKNSFEDLFYSTMGESEPDSNIVLITISENDIAQMGKWPIKRSYYALLIRSLSDYGVKKIGLEIFLSSRFSSQVIYDNLLAREIEKSGRVVLSSFAGEINLKKGKFVTDSLSYPSPKLINNEIPSGHINFINENGIYIPLRIQNNNIEEKAFSLQLSGKDYSRQKIKVNFSSSWKKFKQYSFLEYFQKVNNNSSELASLKNKIVIAGVTDPQIASTGIKTSFDDSLPGLALHAFALSNLMNNSFLHYSLVFSSKIVFIFLIFGLIILQIKKPNYRLFTFYLTSTAIFLLPSFILFSYFQIELAYGFYILPLAVMFVVDLVDLFAEKKTTLEGSKYQERVLRNLLSKKEEELENLEKEFKLTQSSASNVFQDKIKSLKSEIERLKAVHEDRIEAEEPDETNIKNFHGIVYRSKAMAGIVDLIKKSAPEDASILILGESGTGKELAAHAVHSLSGRRENNFIAVNCGALSDSILESELFGHVKGAFTGAIADRTGRFEAANKGTIFLDEIAETSLNFQVKLLRIIQTGDFEKVGSSQTIHTDIRIVAAANKDLEALIKENKFREDLYYRLNVIKIEIPPLRQRKEDIEILAKYFLAKANDNIKISQAILDAFKEYEWKGNVREMEAVIKRGIIFSKSAGRNLIQLTDIPEEITKNIKLDFDDLVIESLRNKKFTHSSINETAKELGNVNRTVVSENFRGAALKIYVCSNFDFEKSVSIISNSEDEEVNDRVKAKLQIFLNNIEKDLNKHKEKTFDEIKANFISKYKNLPQQFHVYLDEVIKRRLS